VKVWGPLNVGGCEFQKHRLQLPTERTRSNRAITADNNHQRISFAYSLLIKHMRKYMYECINNKPIIRFICLAWLWQQAVSISLAHRSL
jgi:hypothetical protein